MKSYELLLSPFVAWFLSQVIKTTIICIYRKEFDFSRVGCDGGMPSSHSSIVAALATSCACCHGFDSASFALSLALALIVMHDASGVRWESGKEASTRHQRDSRLSAVDGFQGESRAAGRTVGPHTPAGVCGCIARHRGGTADARAAGLSRQLFLFEGGGGVHGDGAVVAGEHLVHLGALTHGGDEADEGHDDETQKHGEDTGVDG